MADDDKGVKSATSLPAEHPVEPGAVKPSADDAPRTEWTASDRRGPLDSANEENAGRIVPADESGIEGGVDQTSEAQVSPGSLGATSSDESRPAVEPAERKRSLMPVAAGLVVGALIGAGSAWLVYSQNAGSAGDQQQRLAALSSRVDALDKRPDPQPEIHKLQSGLADVEGKVAAIDNRATGDSKQAAANQDAARSPSPVQAANAPEPAASSQSTTASAGTSAPADTELAGKVAALQAALDEVKNRTSALQAQDAKQEGAVDKVASLQSNLANTQKQAAGAQSALDAVKTEQKQLGDKIAGLTIAVAGALKKAETAQTKAEGAQTKAEGATSEAQSLQTQQKALEGQLGSPALAVVADSLVQQIDAGRPFTKQVDALAALKADPAKIAVLRENAAHGVPSAQALLAQWKPLASPVIASGNKAPEHANFAQRLEHGLFGLVSVHRADSVTGNDLASRVNLIEADLAHDDVPGAYTTWQALPADAKARSQSWGALAKTSVEALAAARGVQQSAIDALGAKKS